MPYRKVQAIRQPNETRDNPGFNRAGRFWPADRPTVVPEDELTPEQWKRIEAEPMLLHSEATKAEYDAQQQSAERTLEDAERDIKGLQTQISGEKREKQDLRDQVADLTARLQALEAREALRASHVPVEDEPAVTPIPEPTVLSASKGKAKGD